MIQKMILNPTVWVNDPETDTHEENNENQNEQSPESIANTEVRSIFQSESS